MIVKLAPEEALAENPRIVPSSLRGVRIGHQGPKAEAGGSDLRGKRNSVRRGGGALGLQHRLGPGQSNASLQ